MKFFRSKFVFTQWKHKFFKEIWISNADQQFKCILSLGGRNMIEADDSLESEQ
jgi:hypothetical protein